MNLTLLDCGPPHSLTQITTWYFQTNFGFLVNEINKVFLDLNLITWRWGERIVKCLSYAVHNKVWWFLGSNWPILGFVFPSILGFVMDKVHEVLYKCCYFQLFDCRVLDYDKFILFFKVHPISSLAIIQLLLQHLCSSLHLYLYFLTFNFLHLLWSRIKWILGSYVLYPSCSKNSWMGPMQRCDCLNSHHDFKHTQKLWTFPSKVDLICFENLKVFSCFFFSLLWYQGHQG